MIRSLTLAALFCAASASTAMAQDTPGAYMAHIPGCVASAASPDEALACMGAGTRNCIDGMPGGMTTVGMMECATAEADAWDALLNAEYQRARDVARRGDDAESMPEFSQRAQTLLEAQRAWITFRDTNCAMEYAAWGSGSMRMTAGADCRLRMTAERTVDLRAYSSGFGDR